MEPITHEVVAEATRRFLAGGGQIRPLPDTVAGQRAWLRFLALLEELEEPVDEP